MGLRILVDTNILLDYLLKREPYEEWARVIIQACQQKIISGCIAAHDKELPFSSYPIQRSQRKNTAQSEKCRVFSDRHGMWV